MWALHLLSLCLTHFRARFICISAFCIYCYESFRFVCIVVIRFTLWIVSSVFVASDTNRKIQLTGNFVFVFPIFTWLAMICRYFYFSTAFCCMREVCVCVFSYYIFLCNYNLNFYFSCVGFNFFSNYSHPTANFHSIQLTVFCVFIGWLFLTNVPQYLCIF